MLDWIEVKIKRIERAISNLDRIASSTFKKWSKRNSSLIKEIDKVAEEIDVQARGAERYLQEANSVGLSEAYASKVRDGRIDIETITDEDLKDKISDYQTWYEKYLDCLDACEELKEKEAELYKQRFDNVSSQYDGILSLMEHEKNMLEGYIDQSETRGWLVSGEYYKALEKSERKNLAELKEEEAALLKSFNEVMASGTVEEYSETWVEMCQEINSVTEAIQESETALLEYQQTLQQLNWEVFDMLQDRISRVTSESEFLIDLMSHDELYKDNGQLTDEGMATMGLYGVGYNVAMAQADKYAEEIKRIAKELEGDPFDTDLQDRYYELVDAQQEAILSAKDYEESIRDLVKGGIEKELDALQDLIDKRKDAMSSAKDLYDYQKKIAKQTKEIASLEKQLGAYSGDTSEEAKATVQKLKVDLSDAQEELKETEYDRYIQDQEKLLDDLYDEYETILNERLDSLELLMTDMTAQINENAGEINQTLMEKVGSVGYDLSDSMSKIWNTSDFTDASGAVNKVITTYGDSFTSALTTTNKALNDISTDIASMIGQLNKIAGTNVKTAQQSAAAKADEAARKAAEAEAAKNAPQKTSSSGGDGTPKIGDKVTFVDGWYYYDSYGASPAGHQYHGSSVYITNINKKGSKPYHISTGSKLGSGDLGWLTLDQLKGYASGKKNILEGELAWTQEDGTEMIVRPSDGAILTPLAKSDSVLSASASKNLWDMANSPVDFIKGNLSMGDIDAGSIGQGQTNFVQNLDKVVFNLPNVRNYDEMLSAMQRDKNFERLIESMTVDRLAGKSVLAKGKAIR